MTIKTQGGKVITQEGKVSCECCLLGCCWYSATQLAIGSYSQNQVPDDIRFFGTTLSKIPGQAAYGTTENGVRFETDTWAVYRNGSRSTRDCLFFGESGFEPDDKTIEDNFEDVYRANVPLNPEETSFDTALIYRTRHWLWEGVQSCGQIIQLAYFPCSFVPPGAKIWGQNQPPTWFLTWRFCEVPPGSQPGSTVGRIGTPTGTYFGQIAVSIP
jgi:hypothetical protein